MKKQISMKKYSIILIALFSLVGMNACDERFEEVNTNPNGISDVDPSHLFAQAARNSFRSGMGYDYKVAGQMSHMFVGVFVERFMDQYLQDLSGETYEDLFNTVYQDLIRYYNEILMLTGPGAEKENVYQYAVADIMAVVSYSKLTDAFGDIPYFNGGLGNLGELSPECMIRAYFFRPHDLNTMVAPTYPPASPPPSRSLSSWRMANYSAHGIIHSHTIILESVTR